MKDFSDRLKQLRKERGLTQTDMAKLLHIYRSTLAGYESEGKEPSQETLCAIAKYFGVTTDYLLGVSSQRNNTDEMFVADTKNIKHSYNTLPDFLKPTVSDTFTSFYSIMQEHIELRNIQHLQLYNELFSLIDKSRKNIQSDIENENVGDPLYLSSLMTAQTTFRNDVSILLDKLMQADIGVASRKKGILKSSQNKSAI